jgi:hypothetical protein
MKHMELENIDLWILYHKNYVYHKKYIYILLYIINGIL